MSITPYFDPLLGKLRVSDVGVVSAASVSIPDPLIISNLQVLSNASINNLHLNNAYVSTATIGNLTTNNISNHSTISTNLLYANGISASTASIGFGTFDRVISSTATLGLTHISTIDWNLTSGATVTQEGQMNWDANQQTAVIGMAGGNVDLALGMEQLFPRRVRNSTGSLMPKGTVVYINGVSGNTPTVERAIATSDMSSAFTLGMTAEDIANTATGWVTTFGELTGLDLSTYTGGDTLYLSGATAGAFTNVIPQSPIHYVRVGTVVKATTDGALVVNVINGFELNELHNVVIASLASGQIIQSGVSSLWYNRSLASAVNELNLLASLGSLAVMNQLSFTSLTNQPSLSSLAFQATIDYTSNQLLNKPSLGSLAIMNQLSFTSLLNQPSLGSLAEMNALSFTSLLNQPSLSSLAFQATVDYSQITNTPSLGSLAVMNQLSFTSLINQPSLGSLAIMNQLSYTSLINLPSLGSLAYGNNVVSPLVLSGTTLSLSIASIAHNNLGGLTTGDPHTQYALLAGRNGGQIFYGGTAANDDLIIEPTSNATKGDIFFLSNGGRMAIGNSVTFTDNAKLNVGESYNSASGIVGLSNIHTKTTAGGFNVGIRNYFEVNVTTGTTDSVGGMFNYVNNDNLGTINFVEAFQQRIDNLGTGTINEASQIKIFTPTNNGTIGNLKGIYIESQTGAGITTGYSIYSEGGTMYHEGSVGIGSASPVTKLFIDGTVANTTRAMINFPSTASINASVGYLFGVNNGTFSGGMLRRVDSADIGLWTQGSGSAPRLNVANNGRVGIGTGFTAPTAQTHIDQNSTTAAIPVLNLDQADLSEVFINFIGGVSTASSGPIWQSGTAATLTHKVRVSFNGNDRWLYLYNG